MPKTRASRTLPAQRERVWEVVADPHSLPRWWPRTQRVEDVGRRRWTEVLRTETGRAVRVDQRLEASEPPALRRWRQELAGSPFEKMLDESIIEIRLEACDDATRVTIELRRRLKGMARFGAFMFRRAGRRLAGEALEGLERACGS